MEISSEMQAQVLMAAADIAMKGSHYEEAEKLFFDALEFSDEAYGPKSFQSATIYLFLAEVSQRLGKLDQCDVFKGRVEAIDRINQQAHESPALVDLIHSL